MFPTIEAGQERAKVGATPAVSIETYPTATTATTAMAADSRHTPARRSETTSDSTMPKPIPRAVAIARSCRKSTGGPGERRIPGEYDPGENEREHGSVASFNADSAMAVCSIFCRIPMRAKSGMRIAIGGRWYRADEEPVEYGTSKASAATEPATSAVMTTPGSPAA